jgi:hypothetical protein
MLLLAAAAAGRMLLAARCWLLAARCSLAAGCSLLLLEPEPG